LDDEGAEVIHTSLLEDGSPSLQSACVHLAHGNSGFDWILFSAKGTAEHHAFDSLKWEVIPFCHFGVRRSGTLVVSPGMVIPDEEPCGLVFAVQDKRVFLFPAQELSGHKAGH
jgi:hypothetical protein